MIRARRLPEVSVPPIVSDPQILEGYLEDASGIPPGHCRGLVRVNDEGEAAALLRSIDGPVLVQAARTSLTGGAVPAGELILSLERMHGIGPPERQGTGATVRVQPGARLDRLQRQVGEHGLYYPPVPTYQQAMLGGSVATNAGGAASFKYGVTRQWVVGLRVLLSNGELLEIERGECRAARGESFRIVMADGSERRIPVPQYRLPDLKKISAGYHSADPLDLIDLFVGSEGTLGVITGITVTLVPRPETVVAGLVTLPDADAVLRLGAALRGAAQTARDRGDDGGPDVRSIEWLDEPSLELLRRHGDDRRHRLRIPGDARGALLFEMEIPGRIDNRQAQELLQRLFDDRAGSEDGPLARLLRLLGEHSALERLELAFPEDDERRQALAGLRESVPTLVGEILRERRRSHPGVHKVGGDIIVPFERLGEMIEIYRNGFEAQGLEHATWGHLGDGNLHPNAIPRNDAEARLAVRTLLDFAGEAVRRGGCPLSEHGVGRNPVKQELLRRFLGEPAIEAMREVKRAMDPEGRFAPGVLFRPRPGWPGADPG